MVDIKKKKVSMSIPREPPKGSPLKRARDGKHSAKRAAKKASEALADTKTAKHGDKKQEHAKSSIEAATQAKGHAKDAADAAKEAEQENIKNESDDKDSQTKEAVDEAAEAQDAANGAKKCAKEAAQIAELPKEELVPLDEKN